jgi:hypothetical protein
LIGKGILVYSSGIIFGVDFNEVAIQPYAMNYLRKHPDLVGFKKADIGTDKLSTRPTANYGVTGLEDL